MHSAGRSTTTRRLVVRFLALQYCLAAICLASAFSSGLASSMTTPAAAVVTEAAPSRGVVHGAFRKRSKKRRTVSTVPRATREDMHNELERSKSNNNNEEEDPDTMTESKLRNEKEDDASNAVIPTEDASDSGSSTSASRWERRKQIALGLVASIATTVGAAKLGVLGSPYTDEMIARDAFMTGLTSVLAVAMNRCITLGYEAGTYDSKTGRKITHILSAPLFIVTWPFFSEAGGARVFAGLVTLTNMYRLYLAGTGDAAESSLANTISRSGDKAEVLGGPFIYVCLFQLFILVFWRNTFPGVVAMTTMAAGDGMADIIGRRYGKNGTKWPFGDGQKSLAGSAAFAVFAFGLTLAVCSWLMATGTLASSLPFSSMAGRILAISVVCALVEVLPVGDDNYTVPGSAAVLAALWLR